MSDERGHPCFVPDLRGKASSFSLLNIIMTKYDASHRFFIGALCQVEDIPLCSLFSESSYLKWVLDFGFGCIS